MGKHMLRLLKFAIRYPGWQPFGREPATIRAIKRLEALGLLQTSVKFRQFRLTEYNTEPDK